VGRSTLDVADAVAVEINAPVGVTWCQKDFECESTILPLFELEQLTTLRLSVMGVETDGERHTRGHVKDMHRVLVGLQKTVSANPKDYREEIKDLVKFLFQMKAYWLTEGRRINGMTSVYCKKAKVHVLYNPEALESQNVYEGLLELNFEEIASG
jgi:hypothetical protein